MRIFKEHWLILEKFYFYWKKGNLPVLEKTFYFWKPDDKKIPIFQSKDRQKEVWEQAWSNQLQNFELWIKKNEQKFFGSDLVSSYKRGRIKIF